VSYVPQGVKGLDDDDDDDDDEQRWQLVARCMQILRDLEDVLMIRAPFGNYTVRMACEDIHRSYH
jgi:hypothetical protein